MLSKEVFQPKAGNQLKDLFQSGRDHLLSIYLTAGYPTLDATGALLEAVQEAGADLVEVGMPYSDPLADGPVIQQSGAQALAAGMTLDRLFDQVAEVRPRLQIPLVWMGYFNAMLQYGPERFAERCAASGFEALILPDLPPEVYRRDFQPLFVRHGLKPVFLVTPQTPEHRIRLIDDCSEGFVYLVASSTLTGSNTGIGSLQEQYLSRVAAMGLRNPLIAGFGIHDRPSFLAACRHARGAIVGSAFLRHIGQSADPVGAAGHFVRSLRAES
ncbi:MAG: tryptophan synthase subunit alpha [Bacteroidetes bacterium]|nr:tryptophan synthase subunit alpha [Bacteroidota bacterium]